MAQIHVDLEIVADLTTDAALADVQTMILSFLQDCIASVGLVYPGGVWTTPKTAITQVS